MLPAESTASFDPAVCGRLAQIRLPVASSVAMNAPVPGIGPFPRSSDPSTVPSMTMSFPWKATPPRAYAMVLSLGKCLVQSSLPATS